MKQEAAEVVCFMEYATVCCLFSYQGRGGQNAESISLCIKTLVETWSRFTGATKCSHTKDLTRATSYLNRSQVTSSSFQPSFCSDTGGEASITPIAISSL